MVLRMLQGVERSFHGGFQQTTTQIGPPQHRFAGLQNSHPLSWIPFANDSLHCAHGCIRPAMKRKSKLSGTMAELANPKRLEGKLVAFTTPADYASRLQHLLTLEGAQPLWSPSIVVETTAQTRQAVDDCLCGRAEVESVRPRLDGIAFTSRAGMKAVAEVLQHREHLLDREGDVFIVAALGRDAELLRELDLFKGSSRVKMLVPSIATPDALVEELGEGNGRYILCPVPLVEGLEEPPVVPNFLHALRSKGWIAVRLNAYITRWAGLDCAKPLLASPDTSRSRDTNLLEQGPSMKDIDALVFTSTAEVEGLIKSLDALGLGGVAALKRGRRPVLAAHGPVTAAGAARLGVEVHVVSKNFHSFAGIIDSLDLYWKSVTSW